MASPAIDIRTPFDIDRGMPIIRRNTGGGRPKQSYGVQDMRRGAPCTLSSRPPSAIYPRTIPRRLAGGGGPPPFGRENSARAMQVQVETFVDEGGVEKLRRFYLNGRQVEVVENLDQWHGADYRYFKVRGSEGDVYILYLDVLRTQWALTMYQRSQSPDSRDAM